MATIDRRHRLGPDPALGGQAIAKIAINLLLPLYLVLFLIPPLDLVVSYAVNGRLLGREYFAAGALRRMDKAAARSSADALIIVLLTVPLLNMIAPVMGAAGVHVFQKLTRAP